MCVEFELVKYVGMYLVEVYFYLVPGRVYNAMLIILTSTTDQIIHKWRHKRNFESISSYNTHKYTTNCGLAQDMSFCWSSRKNNNNNYRGPKQQQQQQRTARTTWIHQNLHLVCTPRRSWLANQKALIAITNRYIEERHTVKTTQPKSVHNCIRIICTDRIKFVRSLQRYALSKYIRTLHMNEKKEKNARSTPSK